jgi:hypothetical protein
MPAIVNPRNTSSESSRPVSPAGLSSNTALNGFPPHLQIAAVTLGKR